MAMEVRVRKLLGKKPKRKSLKKDGRFEKNDLSRKKSKKREKRCELLDEQFGICRKAALDGYGRSC